LTLKKVDTTNNQPGQERGGQFLSIWKLCTQAGFFIWKTVPAFDNLLCRISGLSENINKNGLHTISIDMQLCFLFEI